MSRGDGVIRAGAPPPVYGRLRLVHGHGLVLVGAGAARATRGHGCMQTTVAAKLGSGTARPVPTLSGLSLDSGVSAAPPSAVCQTKQAWHSELCDSRFRSTPSLN